MTEKKTLALNLDDMPLAAVTLNGTLYVLQDLPAGMIDKIARENDATWMTVILSTVTSDLKLMEAVVRAIAERDGFGLPAAFTPKELFELFSVIVDDVPEVPDDPLEDDQSASTNES